MRERIDLTGRTFGRWTVVRRADQPSTIHGKRQWLCRCACGHESLIASSTLCNGHSKSCGCFRTDTTRRRSTKHGLVGSGAYRSWVAAKARCFNPNDTYASLYSERGITMDPRWRDDFRAFYADMGPRPKGMTLDRVDNAGPYARDNCRWASLTVQGNNKRSNRYLEHDGQRMTVAEWARRVGLPAGLLGLRLYQGWSVERALTSPIKPRSSPKGPITYQGQTRTLTEWARVTGLPMAALQQRIRIYGWSVESALTTPLLPPRFRKARHD